MKSTFLTLFFCVSLSESFEYKTHEYKVLDEKIAYVLMRPTVEKWKMMLDAIRYYIGKLKDPAIILAQDCEENGEIVKMILKDGCPNFMNLAVDEENLLQEVGIPIDQIYEFYESRDEIRTTWNEFVSLCAKQNVTL